MPAFPDLPGMSPIEQISGEGGYGDVFLYEQHTPRRRVAVKVLRDQHLDERVRRQFMSEADAMAQLAHPHIVPVFSAGLASDGRPFIVMEYFPGQSLGLRASTERIGVAEALSIGVKIGSAVETAHRAGILHRDIKPANILVSKYGEPSLTDFGIAGQLAEVADDEDQGLSLPWAPPEVVFATAAASYSSDVYSLGATLWHLLVGRSPFENVGTGNSQWEMMQRIRDMPAPSTGLPIPDSLDRLIRQALHKDPNQRPRRVRDLVLALNGVEQELRLRPTKPIIEGEGVPAVGSAPSWPSAPVPSAPRPDATRLKTPVVRQSGAVPHLMTHSSEAKTALRQTVAHPDAPGRSPGFDVSPRPSGRAVGGHGIEADATVRRSVAPGATAPSAIVEQTAPHKPRYGVMAVAAALLLAAVGIGFLLTRGNSGAKPVTVAGTSSPAGHTALSGDLVPPGPVTVRGTRVDDGKVQFTWSYSAAKSDDTFQWRTDDSVLSGVAKTTAVDVPAQVGTKVCLRVKVVRADGSNAALEWSIPGCVQ